MILWLASFPRSGNTFCRVVLEKCFGISTLSDSDYYSGNAPTRPPTPWHERTVSKLGLQPPVQGSIAELSARPELLALKTHSLERLTSDPALYLVRDGRDALLSYACYIHTHVQREPLETLTREKLVQRLRSLLLRNDPTYGSWSENVRTWSARPDVAVIPFHELIARPVAVVDAALQRLGCARPVLDSSVPTFKDLHSRAPQFFRSGRHDQWRTEFPPELQAQFLERHGPLLSELGYDASNRAA